MDVVGHEDDLLAVCFSWIGNITYRPRLWAPIDGATKLAKGKNKREALRCLKRRISDAI